MCKIRYSDHHTCWDWEKSVTKSDTTKDAKHDSVRSWGNKDENVSVIEWWVRPTCKSSLIRAYVSRLRKNFGKMVTDLEVTNNRNPTKLDLPVSATIDQMFPRMHCLMNSYHRLILCISKREQVKHNKNTSSRNLWCKCRQGPENKPKTYHWLAGFLVSLGSPSHCIVRVCHNAGKAKLNHIGANLGVNLCIDGIIKILQCFEVQSPILVLSFDLSSDVSKCKLMNSSISSSAGRYQPIDSLSKN